MQLVVSPAAAGFLHDQGDRLYVWATRNRCCGGGLSLEAAVEAPPGREFCPVDNTAGISLFLPAALPELPDELHIDLQRWPRRVRAYWNGCIYVV